MRQRSLYRRALKLNGCFLFERLGMTDFVACSSSSSRSSALSYALSPSTGRGAVGFHVRGVDHLRVRRSSLSGELSEQIFPDAAPCPANKSVIDRFRMAIFGRATAPTATAFQ